MSTPPGAEPSPRGIADYAFLEELGRGGHGRTFLARRPERLPVDAERVVVKVLDRRATPEEFARVAEELRVVAAVGSEHLVQLYDVGHAGGLVYYAMAHHPEGSLASPAAALAPAQAARAVADAARGAHALHEVGVVHRAIAPSNILLEGGRGRLADPGLAHLQAPGMSSTGLGTAEAAQYVAPDVLLGHGASRLTDVWSLGICLHRALTGHGVYPGLAGLDTVSALRGMLQARPEIRAELADGHREVVERCLTEDPWRRFRTAAELADAIEAAGAAR